MVKIIFPCIQTKPREISIFEIIKFDLEHCKFPYTPLSTYHEKRLKLLFLTNTQADGLSEGRRTINFVRSDKAKSTGYFFRYNLNFTTFLEIKVFCKIILGLINNEN